MNDFVIDTNKEITHGIKKVINDQIDHVIQICSDENKWDIHKFIHEIRKSFKRIRAVLRLVRDEIGYDNYSRENIFYRDTNRKLSIYVIIKYF